MPVNQKTVMTLINKVISNPRISKPNKEAAEQMLAYMQAKGSRANTVAKHLYCFEKYLSALDSNVDAKTASRQEIEKAMAKIESSALGEETKRNIRVVIKSFYKHFVGEDLYYPRQIAWIKTTVNKNRKLLPEGLLDEQDVVRLIDATTNPRDRAIIAMLYDTGMRAGELLSMRRKDLDLEGNPAHAVINGKTGPRRIPLMFSVPYLAQWIDMRNGIKAQDFLWIAIGSWYNLDKPMEYSGLRIMLQKVAKKAGIEKRVHPHLFRHSRASNYANRLTEQQLKAYFGWTGDSKMTATYVHLSGRDIDNAILEANGIAPSKERSKPKLSTRVCPRCRYPNMANALHCGRCGSPLDIGLVMKEAEDRKALEELAARSFDSEEEKKKVAKKVKQRKDEEK